MTLKFCDNIYLSQNILMMKSDLRTLSTEVIFWNWNIKPAGVICRLDPKSKDSFYKSPSLNIAVDKFLLDNNCACAEKVQEQIP